LLDLLQDSSTQQYLKLKNLTWVSLNVGTRNCCWELGWVSIFEFKLAHTHTHTHMRGRYGWNYMKDVNTIGNEI
jgi:hypothetical protein